MASRALHRFFSAFVLFLALFSQDANAQCRNDRQCKGDRVCEDGRCVSPPSDCVCEEVASGSAQVSTSEDLFQTLFSDPELAAVLADGGSLLPSELSHIRMRSGTAGASGSERKTVKIRVRGLPAVRRRGGRIYFYGYRESDLVDGRLKQNAIPVDYGRMDDRIEPGEINPKGEAILEDWVDGLYYQLVYSAGVTPESGSPKSDLAPFRGEPDLLFIISDGRMP